MPLVFGESNEHTTLTLVKAPHQVWTMYGVSESSTAHNYNDLSSTNRRKMDCNDDRIEYEAHRYANVLHRFVNGQLYSRNNLLHRGEQISKEKVTAAPAAL